MDATWTLDSLTARIDAVLQHEGIRQHNGQVAPAPNARAIRWYQSTGLLRRPEQRGRVAFYSPMHLAEVVAIKRLQADGMSLDDVQTRLHGLSDDAIMALAAVPALADPDTVTVTAVAADDDEASSARASFWGADVEDAVVVPVVAAASDITSRQTFDHPTGVSLSLPHTIDADVAAAILQRVVDELVAGGQLPPTPPGPVEDETTTEEKSR